MKRILLLCLFSVCGAFAQVTPFQPDVIDAFNFGRHVSTSGNRVICTASNMIPLHSKVYIFEYDGNQMVQKAVFAPVDGESLDNYGASVAISDEYAAVGAPLMDNDVSTPDQGAVYLYKRDGDDWQQIEKIILPDAAAGDRFGTKVAIDGGKLYASAPNKAYVGGSGIIFIYDITSTGVANVQSLYEPGHINFGEILEVEGNLLATNSHHELLQQKNASVYQLESGQWNWLAGTAFMDLMHDPLQIRLNNGRIYIARNDGNPNPLDGTVIESYALDGGALQLEQTIVSTIDDNIYSDFDVAGDHMLIGMSNYILTGTRNSPVNHYIKSDGQWILQEALYNTTDYDGTDDAFGSSISMSDDLFVIGSHKSLVLDRGLAFYMDASLGSPKFESALGLYPNPTSGMIYWTADSGSYSIFNLQGQRVHFGKADAGQADLSELRPGMYLLEMQNNGKKTVSKVVRR